MIADCQWDEELTYLKNETADLFRIHLIGIDYAPELMKYENVSQQMRDLSQLKFQRNLVTAITSFTDALKPSKLFLSTGNLIDFDYKRLREFWAPQGQLFAEHQEGGEPLPFTFLSVHQPLFSLCPVVVTAYFFTCPFDPIYVRFIVNVRHISCPEELKFHPTCPALPGIFLPWKRLYYVVVEPQEFIEFKSFVLSRYFSKKDQSIESPLPVQ